MNACLIVEAHEMLAKKQAVLTEEEKELEKSDWIGKIENLLAALEMYRVQEEKALKTMEEVLAAHGVTLTVEELKEVPPEELREQLHKKAAPAR